jgi:hypothetical protein
MDKVSNDRRLRVLHLGIESSVETNNPLEILYLISVQGSSASTLCTLWVGDLISSALRLTDQCYSFPLILRLHAHVLHVIQALKDSYLSARYKVKFQVSLAIWFPGHGTSNESKASELLNLKTRRCRIEMPGLSIHHQSVQAILQTTHFGQTLCALALPSYLVSTP